MKKIKIITWKINRAIKYPFIYIRNFFRVKRFPFIKHIYWGNDKWWNRYDMTWYDQIPEGWRKTFGWMMMKDIKRYIKTNNLEYNMFEFSEIKEKYGQLRIYSYGPQEILDIIDDYADISEHICMICGKIDTPIINIGGWIYPICKDCYENVYTSPTKAYKDLVNEDDYYNAIIPKKRLIYKGQDIIERDISYIVNRLI